MSVVKSGGVEAFVSILSSSLKEENREQAAWALGNIAGDSTECRDYVLAQAALPPLIHHLTVSNSKSFLRNATWSLSNLVRGKPLPPLSVISPALKPLYRLVQAEDEEVLSDACWALSYISDGEDNRIEAIIQEGFVPRLVSLLSHENVSVLLPALRTVGNIVTGNETQTQVALDNGVLQHITTLINNTSNRSIIKECSWALSNITAGSPAQIQCVINVGLFPVIVRLIAETEFEIKKELIWAVTNAISGGTNSQVANLIGQGILKPICDALNTYDTKLVLICLEALEKALRVGDTLTSSKTGDMNPVSVYIERLGALEVIEDLQSHANKDVLALAENILSDYFDSEEEGENMSGNTQASHTQFSFGVGNAGSTNFVF